MYIDFVTVMLVNLVAGLVLLAAWIFLDAGTNAERRWLPGLIMATLVALVTGFYMVFTWPLPGPYNILYGELSAFFGVLLLGIVIVIATGLDLLPVAIYAAFVGVAAVLVGIQVLRLSLTQTPVLSGVGFIWLGVLGLGAVPVLRMRGVPAFRVFGAAGLLVAAVIWAVIAYMAYWGHVAPFAQWRPANQQVQQTLNRPQ